VELNLEYLWLSEVNSKSLCHVLSILISLADTHAPLLLRPRPVAPRPRLVHPSNRQHALIENILLTARGFSNKYSHDILDILALSEHREELDTDEGLMCRMLPGRA
jgi:hypothetical protein